MESWQPLPTAMAAGLVKCRWTKENPAPEAVVYLWVWTLLYQGASVSIRDAAEYAAWSRWKAEQILKGLKEEKAGWAAKPDDSRQQPDSTPKQSQVVTEPNQTATRHTHAGAQLNTTRKLDLKNKVNPNLGLADTWKKINDARKEGGKARALKLTDKRRRNLKARLRENKEEDLLRVVDWWLRSSHDRAEFLRDGGYDVDTLFSTKFDQYIGFARSDAERVHRPKKGSYRSLSDLLDEALDEPETLNRMVIPFPNQE